ncbi:MAG: hypothetical protein QF724_12595, partial [Planctomycetota bacterium]|nr:hypothetical protein [Planctomycetota bacterium]
MSASLLLPLLAGLYLGAPQSAPQPPPLGPAPLVITELPYTIGEPGRYILTADLEGVAGQDGLSVAADDVLIDLGGFKLTG